MIIEKSYPLLYKILTNWPKEAERPPLLLNGVRDDDWNWLKDEIVKIFIGKDVQIENHPDILILEKEERKSSIEVEKTRIFIDQLSLSSFELPLKIGIIPDANDLNIPSQNALLKTLEEPLPRRYLIMGIASKDKLLPTILSRVTIVNLSREVLPDETTGDSQKDAFKFYETCSKSSLPKRLKLGQEWTEGKTPNIINFFNALLPELRKYLKKSLKEGDRNDLKNINTQIKKVLECQDQLSKTSGANPKLLFEAFLLQL